MEPYIIHYHIYKNAGTTVIRSLQNYFGEAAVLELDKDPLLENVKCYDAALIRRLIEDRPEVKCFSAHRLLPSIHLVADFPVLPILYLRHPLLRAASVHRFDRQRKDSWFGKKFAETFTFDEWLTWAMLGDVTLEAKNYQTAILSLTDKGSPSWLTHTPTPLFNAELVRNRLDRIPVVGLVEEPKKSAEAFAGFCEGFYSGLRFESQQNQTKQVADWRAELDELENGLSAKTVERFKVANTQDYALFDEYRYVLQ